MATSSNHIRIFLASSSELSRERNFIGNRIRVLSDEWEPRGVRIVLNVWEDYEPEYKDERKQTQYDKDLVDKSNIVFGLFRSVCGKYSQEEVMRAHGNNPNNLHCYKLPSDNSDAVLAFAATNGIEIEPLADQEEVWERIKLTTEEYIVAHCSIADEPLTIDKEKFYLTLGEDLRAEENAVGNMIRGVDMLADQQIGMRCMLLPLLNSRGIADSDYYIAMFDKVLDAQSSREFVTAYNGLSRSKHPAAIAPFQKKDGSVTRYDAGNAVSDLLNKDGKEFFPIVYESLDTVKLTLIVHLL